jgi:putative flippase GtrA
VLLVLGGTGYVYAKLISFAVSTANGYVWNRMWTFGHTPFGVANVAKYVTVQTAGVLVNLGVLTLLIEGAMVAPIPAQVLAAPFVVAVTYLSNRHWTFAASRS